MTGTDFTTNQQKLTEKMRLKLNDFTDEETDNILFVIGLLLVVATCLIKPLVVS